MTSTQPLEDLAPGYFWRGEPITLANVKQVLEQLLQSYFAQHKRITEVINSLS